MSKIEEPRRLYQQVADKIRQSIGAKGLKAGARLPSERDLAQELGVSRPSLREALIALEIEGTVEIRGGSGIYLTADTPRDGGMSSIYGESPSELMQARSMVEGSAVLLAASRITEEALADLQQMLSQMAETIASGQIPLEQDKAFHLCIARQTGNSVIEKLVAGLFEERHNPIAKRLQERFGGGKSWSLALQEHHAIFDALSARDPLLAQAEMHRHLNASRRRWLETKAFDSTAVKSPLV
ncbi:FadR/GntR family transcriptional regulator [Rhizobium sp. C1]|uniref:FadR/GntR family transcriptional regulator n=1 Tax=Rhizobium sp. C1 TaxID=1349799 RepID=UPI001E6362A1|nr:FadR/GntR family transcriptional regulator [Rhizobium sp. C1]MCD2179438.1 FadR family transcriptional regulator [Rhizobium sp. C1]